MKSKLTRIFLGTQVPYLLSVGIILFFSTSPQAAAQEVIVHTSFSNDDGDPKLDADGTRNGSFALEELKRNTGDIAYVLPNKQNAQSCC